VLRNGEELSHQEIADRLGLSRSSVEKHLARALRLLREAMGGRNRPARPTMKPEPALAVLSPECVLSPNLSS